MSFSAREEWETCDGEGSGCSCAEVQTKVDLGRKRRRRSCEGGKASHVTGTHSAHRERNRFRRRQYHRSLRRSQHGRHAAMRSICSPLHRALAGGALARLRASTLPAASRQLHHRPRTALVRPQPARPRSLAPLTRLRLESSARAPAASAPAPPAAPAVPAAVPSLGAGRSKEDAPAYELTFTCKRCAERSTHRVSKQGFHHGTVLITCPGCKNRHLISDHLKVSCSRVARAGR